MGAAPHLGPSRREPSRRAGEARAGGAGPKRGSMFTGKMTEEHKAKIAAANRGRKHTEQARANMRQAQAGAGLGRKLSADHRAKISAGLMGHEVSNETRIKIVKANTGNKNSLGRVVSDEVRAKWQGNKSALGYKHTTEARAKISAAMKKRFVSDETRAKMSAAAKRRGMSAEVLAAAASRRLLIELTGTTSRWVATRAKAATLTHEETTPWMMLPRRGGPNW
jgi:NUMOD3 motif